MPLELNVIQASEFVCVDADEELDLEASKKALRALALACRKRGLDRALLDVRTVPIPAKPQFTTSELAELAKTFQEAGFSRDERLAVLYREDVHGGIKNFAFISRMRGMQVQAFTDFESALFWLSERPESVAESECGISIPIIKRKKEPRKLSVGLERLKATRGEQKAENRGR